MPLNFTGILQDKNQKFQNKSICVKAQHNHFPAERREPVSRNVLTDLICKDDTRRQENLQINEVPNYLKQFGH